MVSQLMCRVYILILVLSVLVGSALQLDAQSVVCYNNGSPGDRTSTDLGFLTHFGEGCNSAHVSALQSDSQGLRNFGFSSRLIKNTTLAEDFVLTKEEYLTSVDFYAFNDEPGIEPLIQEVKIRIWDGIPGGAASTIIFGDLNENRLLGSEFSGYYRTNERTIPSCIRPIMKITAALDIRLEAGTYWIEWQFQVPNFVNHYRTVPITIKGVAMTGNSIQSIDGGITFEPVVDLGKGDTQGLPFVISCSQPPASAIPTMGEWGLIILALFLLIIGVCTIKEPIHRKTTCSAI